MLKFVSKAVPLIDHLDHNDRISHEELLNQAGSLDFGMGHEKHNHDLYLVDEGEKVQEFGYIVQDRVKYPVRGPMGELCVVDLFAARLGQEEERLVRRVKQVAEDVDRDEQDAAQVDEERVAEDIEHND